MRNFQIVVVSTLGVQTWSIFNVETAQTIFDSWFKDAATLRLSSIILIDLKNDTVIKSFIAGGVNA